MRDRIRWSEPATLAVAAVLLLLLCAPATATAAVVNLLANPSFENPAGGPAIPGWGQFSNAFHDTTTPRTGGSVAKLFGSFNGGFGVSGVFQDFPASPGDIFELSVFSRHNTGDALTGVGAPNDNWVVQKIAFFNGATEIGGVESTILSGVSPTDTWIDNAAIQGTAPAGTTHVQPLILFLQPGPPNDPGAGLFDDAVFGLVPEPSGVALLGLAGLGLLRRRSRRTA
jgi:hypothetical protein